MSPYIKVHVLLHKVELLAADIRATLDSIPESGSGAIGIYERQELVYLHQHLADRVVQMRKRQPVFDENQPPKTDTTRMRRSKR
jgi:hypothetical protein